MTDQWQSPYLLFVVSNDRSVAVSVSFVCCFHDDSISGSLRVFCLLFPMIDQWQSPCLLFVVSNRSESLCQWQWPSLCLLFVVSSDRSVAVSVVLLFVVSNDRSVAVSASFVYCFQR